MFKKLSLLALLAATSVGSLEADFPMSGNNQFRVTGEYLYLLPTIDDSAFVINSPVTSTFPNGKRENNNPQYHSGYRVGAGYSFCDCDSELLAAYTYLQFDQSKNVSGDFLWATLGRADFASAFENYAGTASSKLKFRYQRIDALYAHQLYDRCNLDVAILFGIEGAELRLKERYNYASVTNAGTVNQYSKISGLGPQFGFALNYLLYKFCGCLPGTLSFNVGSSASLLMSDSKVNSSNTLDDLLLLDVSNQKSWRVIPALHANVGLSFDTNISCYQATLKVGYEFSSYLRGLTRLSFPDDVADSLSYNNYYNFDVQGLYVSGSFRF